MNANGTILLVEDDGDDQFFFQDTLKQLKYPHPCIMVKNGLEAIDYVLSGNEASIIFLDLNMPIMNGWDCLVQLKKHQESKHIPVVIFTTTDDPETINQMRTLGADAFFRKPNDYREMLGKLKILLSTDLSNKDGDRPFQW